MKMFLQEIKHIRSEEVWTFLLLATGPIPGTLEAPGVVLGHNLLEGAIPQRLLHGRDALEKWVAARASESKF
eukprot:4318979-Amphidinium_carterae.1